MSRRGMPGPPRPERNPRNARFRPLLPGTGARTPHRFLPILPVLSRFPGPPDVPRGSTAPLAPILRRPECPRPLEGPARNRCNPHHPGFRSFRSSAAARECANENRPSQSDPGGNRWRPHTSPTRPRGRVRSATAHVTQPSLARRVQVSRSRGRRILGLSSRTSRCTACSERSGSARFTG
jgi:hypothetical protein